MGKAAASGFTVYVLSPHKSIRHLKIKGKSRKLEKWSWKRLCVGDGHTVDCGYPGSFLTWMEVQSTHSKMILYIHLNGTDFLYACNILKVF